MAWMLCEEIVKVVVTFVVVLFLKRVKGVVMESQKCMIKTCVRQAAVDKRGLCLVCYGQAKKKVESGQTTWDTLVHLGLCKPESNNPFDDAYTQATEGE